ncbi:MAG: hypothetical protein EXS14_07035 [Planctomycetes bacterium]|nr:hypothetical protein [Planctomycetota bacterium]
MIYTHVLNRGPAGVQSPADFAMSKIAANETYGGNMLRKAIDYFCHLAVAPEFLSRLRIIQSDRRQTDSTSNRLPFLPAPDRRWQHGLSRVMARRQL